MGPLSKNKRIDGSRNTADKNETNVKFLQGQLQLYSDLSKALEEKLEQRNRQIKTLRQELEEKHAAFQDLQHDYKDQVSKIQDLEETCIARSAKVSQLVQVIAAKKTSEMQEVLLEKSLQVADLVQERHKLEREIVNLEEELAATKVTAVKLKQDRDKNNKLLLELSDIVRTLNTIAVEYERVDNKYTDDESATSGSSASMPMNQPLRNVKRKIQAIEHDRQRLVQERDMLRRENEAKDAQIAALEASFQLLNDKTRSKSMDEHDDTAREGKNTTRAGNEGGGRQPCHSTYDRGLEDSSKEVSYQEFVEEKKDDDDEVNSPARRQSDNVVYMEVGRSLSVVEEDVSSTSSSGSDSSESSFSTLQEPPNPSVDLKEHAELKQKFDKALDVIEKLRHELSKRIRKESKGPASSDTGGAHHLAAKEAEIEALRERLSISSNQLEKLERAFDRIQVEHEKENQDHRTLVQELRKELDDRRREYEDALHRSEHESEEVRNMNEVLKKQYEDLETEYTMKIDSLEQQVRETQVETQQTISALQASHKEEMERTTRAHTTTIKEKEQSLHDLKFEYDTFLEVHLKAEDEAKKEKELYKEALKKIVVLETELSEAQDKLTAANLAHQEELLSIKEKKAEAIQKYNKLKHGYEILKENNSKEMKEAFSKIENLQQDNQITVMEYERRVEDLERKQREIRHDFDLALIDHGKKMQIAEFQYQQLKADYDASTQEQTQRIEVMKSNGEKQLKDLVERVKRESKHEMDQQALKHQEALDQQRKNAELEAVCVKKLSDEELEKVKAESQKVLKQRQAEFLEMLDQCQRAKEESETALLNKLDEQKKKMVTLQSETTKQLEKQRYEANVLLDKVQSELKLEIDRLAAENTSLHESKREGDDMKVLYRELASSYQSALFKIEMLLKSSRSHRAKNGQDGFDSGKTSTSVMEKIRFLEEQAGKTSKNFPVLSSVSKRANSDPTFQRDFNALIDRLGLQNDAPLAEKDEESNNDACSSFACSSISLESVLARKNAKSAPKQTEMDSTEATDNMSSTHDGRIETVSPEQKPLQRESLVQDLIIHFTCMRKVNSSIVCRCDTGKAGSMETELLDNTERSSTLPTEAVFEAQIEAQKMQAETIRNKVQENAAEIVSQAREKELRLLERQFCTLKKRFEDALRAESIKASKEKESRPKDIEMKTSNSDPSYPLELALSSVTSEGGDLYNTTSFALSEVECLRKQLLGAELKAKLTKRRLESSRSQASQARKQREEGNKNLQTAMDRLQSLNEAEIHRRLDLAGSFPDSKHMTSLSNDLEDSENLFPLPMIQVDELNDITIVSHLDGESNHRDFQPRELGFSQSILSIQEELKQARYEARIAKEKQLEREENLRDVILQYKLLESEHQQLSKKLSQQPLAASERSVSASSENLYNEMVQEHDTAHKAMKDFQKELDNVQKSLQDAQENRDSRRDAIDKYKSIQEEFLSVFEEKKELEKILYITDRTTDEPSGDNVPTEGVVADTIRSTKQSATGSHRGLPSKVTVEGSDRRGTVRERIRMLEAANSKIPSPPSNPSTLESPSEGGDDDDEEEEPEVSLNDSAMSKKSKKGKKMGFLRGNRMGFVSKLPSLGSSKSSGNKVKA